MAGLAADAGADALLLVSPYYNKPTQAGLIAHCRAVADTTDLPVMLYDIPARTGIPFSTDALIQLAEHPNIALIRSGFDAFNRGDVDHLSKIFASDCVQHMAGSNRFTGDHKGRDTVLAMYGELAAETDGTFAVALERLYANDHRAVATFRSTATRKGKKLDQQSTLVFEITGGKITDIDELAIDGKVDDAFWG